MFPSFATTVFVCSALLLHSSLFYTPSHMASRQQPRSSLCGRVFQSTNLSGDDENNSEDDGSGDMDEKHDGQIGADDEVFTAIDMMYEAEVSNNTADDGCSPEHSPNLQLQPSAPISSNVGGRIDPRVTAIARQQSSMASSTNTDDKWERKDVPGTGFVRLRHKDPTLSNIIDITVTKNRVKKGMEKLDPSSITAVQNKTSSCQCKTNQCQMKFSFLDIIACRKHLFGNANLATEQRVTEAAVAVLTAENPDATPTKSLRYFANNNGTKIKVCSRFWAAMYGLCETKMKKVREMVKNKSTTTVHGGKGQLNHPRMTSQSTICHAFWSHFFEKNCQRPTDQLRLFPVNKPFQVIYDQYFIPWFNKRTDTELGNNGVQDITDERVWAPGFSTFYMARKHKDFSDVADRPRHYHCKCKTCDELNTIRLRGFVDDSHKAAYEVAFKAHEADARGWHEHEEKCKSVSRRQPHESMVIGYDDTSELGLPKMTNRDPKNLTKTRLNFIPFNITNYTTGKFFPFQYLSLPPYNCKHIRIFNSLSLNIYYIGETAYVYTLKNRYKKGANRLCTVLYYYLRKIKFGTHPCRHAKTLYLHADNYGENKNNVVLQFLSELGKIYL